MGADIPDDGDFGAVHRFGKEHVEAGVIDEDDGIRPFRFGFANQFEVYFDKAGLYRYRLIASNGESIAICEEGYKSKSGCLNGMKSVSVNAVDAEIIDESLEK